MPNTKIHINFYKTATVILLLVFSLSPCAVKRDILGIFEIQHINTLNKTKTTASPTKSCSHFTTKVSKVSAFKIAKKFHKYESVIDLQTEINSEKKIVISPYSGLTTGNSPPKYILFKRLKLHLV